MGDSSLHYLSFKLLRKKTTVTKTELRLLREELIKPEGECRLYLVGTAKRDIYDDWSQLDTLYLKNEEGDISTARTLDELMELFCYKFDSTMRNGSTATMKFEDFKKKFLGVPGKYQRDKFNWSKDNESDFPVQFTINNYYDEAYGLSNILYLEQCTYTELKKIAEQQFTDNQLKKYTLCIIDDEYNMCDTDDDLFLKTAFKSRTPHVTPEHPLHLSIDIDLKEETKIANNQDQMNESKEIQDSLIHNKLNADDTDHEQLYFEDFSEVPPSFADPFFNGWSLLQIPGQGNCLHIVIGLVFSLAGCESCTPLQIRRLLHDTIAIMKRNPQFVNNDVLMANINSADVDISEILVNGNYINDCYSDTFLFITQQMVRVNINIYQNGVFKADGQSSMGWNKEFLNTFASWQVSVSTNVESHWNIAVPQKYLSQIGDKYPVICSLGTSLNSANIFRNASDNDDESKDIDVNICECPHGNLTIKELSDIKIRKRDTFYIVGLPNTFTETTLRTPQWFGQFGNITRMSFDHNGTFTQYQHNISALNAITFYNKCLFASGKRLKAKFAFQSYCKYFLQKTDCANVNCLRRHSWCKQEDIITEKDRQHFKAIPPNTNTKLQQYQHDQKRGWLIYQKKWLEKSQLQQMEKDYGARARNLGTAPKILFTDNDIDHHRAAHAERKHDSDKDLRSIAIGEYDRSYLKLLYGIIAQFTKIPELSEFKKLMDQQFTPLQEYLLRGHDVIVVQPTNTSMQWAGKHKFYMNHKQVIYHTLGVYELPFRYIEYIQNKIDELREYAEKIDTVEVYTFVPNQPKKQKYAKNRNNSNKSVMSVDDKTLNTIQNLHDKWFKNKDINVKNLAIYLNNLVDGYNANIDVTANHGYSKFGNYSRTFLEAACNLLIGKYNTYSKKFRTLGQKIKMAKKQMIKEPVCVRNQICQKMHFIRSKTNTIVHSVKYGENAAHRYLPENEQQQIFKNIYDIAIWLNKYHIKTE